MKRTPLIRRTPLRAKRWGVYRTNKKPKESPTIDIGATRPDILARAGFRCEYCHEPIRGDNWEDHHVFYRSHVGKAVRHQVWNRMALHDECHTRAHLSSAIRRFCETEALVRLYKELGPAGVEAVIALTNGATEPAAFVRAYEVFYRGRGNPVDSV